METNTFLCIPKCVQNWHHKHLWRNKSKRVDVKEKFTSNRWVDGNICEMAVVMAGLIQLNEISVTMAHSDLNSRLSISSFAFFVDILLFILQFIYGINFSAKCEYL